MLTALRQDAEDIAAHLREPEPRMPWSRIKDQAEALVGAGLSREEAMRHAGPSEWAGGGVNGPEAGSQTTGGSGQADPLSGDEREADPLAQAAAPEAREVATVPIVYLCPGCMRRFDKPGRCAECTKEDNRRRNAKRAAHGRTTAWWRRFRRTYIGSECERCGSTDYLTFHFKPGGVHNANPADYETLCRRCHGAVDAPRAHG